jgi:hypothetical protein
MYKYQNVSETTQTLTNDGVITPRVVEPGETVESSIPIENPNFKYMGDAVSAPADTIKTETKESE